MRRRLDVDSDNESRETEPFSMTCFVAEVPSSLAFGIEGGWGDTVLDDVGVPFTSYPEAPACALTPVLEPGVDGGKSGIFLGPGVKDRLVLDFPVKGWVGAS